MTPELQPQHRRAAERIAAHFADDPGILAVLVGGSVAKGYARPDSDMDVVLVATDEEYARRAAAGDLHYYTTELTEYAGGYVDGKIVDLAYLRDAAQHASEPTRWAFVGAITLCSRLPELDALVAAIAAYPEHERDAKIKAFFSQLLIWGWYAGEADKRGDPYLTTRVAAEVALFGSRLILAHNRMLFPFHKWMLTELRRAPERPAEMLDRLDALLRTPGEASCRAFVECVAGFRDWGVSFGEAVIRFMEDTELAWRGGRPPLGDW